ncbi:hypothetical protein [Persicobacter diffluens]
MELESVCGDTTFGLLLISIPEKSIFLVEEYGKVVSNENTYFRLHCDENQDTLECKYIKQGKKVINYVREDE